MNLGAAYVDAIGKALGANLAPLKLNARQGRAERALAGAVRTGRRMHPPGSNIMERMAQGVPATTPHFQPRE